MKIIQLILYSDDIPQYVELKRLSSLYNEEMSKQYDYKYFFILFKEDLTSDIVEEDHVIYVKGKESITPGLYEKTIKAIEYVNSKYEYDYLVRTNVSSFWKIPSLFELAKTFPKSGATGVLTFNDFISGTNIILTKDVATTLTTYKEATDIDDVLISRYLKRFTTITPLNVNKMSYCTTAEEHNEHQLSDDILYYRVKHHDRNKDVALFKKLLLDIYNITA